MPFLSQIKLNFMLDVGSSSVKTFNKIPKMCLVFGKNVVFSPVHAASPGGNGIADGNILQRKGWCSYGVHGGKGNAELIGNHLL